MIKKEKIKDNIEVIRSHQSKDRQYNDKKNRQYNDKKNRQYNDKKQTIQ